MTSEQQAIELLKEIVLFDKLHMHSKGENRPGHCYYCWTYNDNKHDENCIIEEAKKFLKETTHGK